MAKRKHGYHKQELRAAQAMFDHEHEWSAGHTDLLYCACGATARRTDSGDVLDVIEAKRKRINGYNGPLAYRMPKGAK